MHRGELLVAACPSREVLSMSPAVGACWCCWCSGKPKAVPRSGSGLNDQSGVKRFHNDRRPIAKDFRKASHKLCGIVTNSHNAICAHHFGVAKHLAVCI